MNLEKSLIEHHYIQLEEVKIHYISAGNSTKPTLVLLHGFPEFWWSWNRIIEGLVMQEFHLIIPDQRGYNLSDKPNRISDYTIDKLAKDIIDLTEGLGIDQFYLAGHDWGAAVSWFTALTYPDKIIKLIILNVPHPHVTMRLIRSRISQLSKSWYMFAFQIPLLPEFISKIGNWRILQEALLSSSEEGTFTRDDLKRYIKSWTRGNAIKYMINWYRAAFRYSSRIKNPQVQMPVLIIWGKRDQFLEFEGAKLSLRYCRDGTLIPLDSTHWVQHERPEEVVHHMVEFINR